MPGIAANALFAAALPNALVRKPVTNMCSRPTHGSGCGDDLNDEHGTRLLVASRRVK